MTEDPHARANAEQLRLLQEALLEPPPLEEERPEEPGKRPDSRETPRGEKGRAVLSAS